MWHTKEINKEEKIANQSPPQMALSKKEETHPCPTWSHIIHNLCFSIEAIEWYKQGTTLLSQRTFTMTRHLWGLFCITHNQKDSSFLHLGETKILTQQHKRWSLFFFFGSLPKIPNLTNIISNIFMLGTQCAVSYCNKIWVFLYTLWILQII